MVKRVKTLTVLLFPIWDFSFLFLNCSCSFKLDDFAFW